MILLLIVLCVVCLAWANGANDNFKGVATLFGSGTTSYRGALAWATVCTLLGSLTAVLLAPRLLAHFSGKGLVDEYLVANADYAAAVALGAGLTVLLATRCGMPVSTTHGLVGALVGAGWAAGSAVDWPRLASSFFLPLIVSPLMAALAVALFYPLLRSGRQRLGISAQTCLCIGSEVVEVMPTGDLAIALRQAERLTVRGGTTVTCQRRYAGRMLGFEIGALLDRLHYLSAGVVSFSRGVNDTPKIAALLLVAPQLTGLTSTALVGVTIAVGGVMGARRIAETMSQRITSLNVGPGLTSNLVTGLIVIGASRFGLPVSTTHVSCGSLFGIGCVTREAHWDTILKILAAWLVTLPLGAGLGAVSFWLLRAL